MPRVTNRAALLAGLLVTGCARPPSPEVPLRREDPEPAAAVPIDAGPRRPDAPASAPDPGTPVVIVTDAAVVRAVDDALGGFGGVVLGREAPQTADMASDPRWRAIADTLTADLRELARADPRSGVGMRHVHRLFDARWLRSPKTRLELVAVVNRVDRQPFAPSTCGELRLIYRLAYTTTRGDTEIDSRLPMTVNVVHHQTGDCREVARRWHAPEGTPSAAWLVSDDGPLVALRGAPYGEPKSVEVDVQVARWPSTIRPDMAGHAEYVLRVFRVTPQGLVPSPLENTPDVPRLRRDASLRAELLAWLRDPAHLDAIDAGTAVLPDRFLATRAISVTPRGLARGANRPFAQLFDPSELADLDLSGRTHVSSPVAFLRRLDGLSCMGCHQTRSVAGFHLLGEEADPEAVVDAIALPGSPHLDGELVRRERILAALVRREVPDYARPLSDAERAQGGYGSHCGLGDPGLAAYTCDEGFVCLRVDEDEMGVCVPEHEHGAGDPCEIGTVDFVAHPHRDRVRDATHRSCSRGGACFTNYGGFPAGMCAVACSAATADEVCGLIPILKDFNACIGRKRPFRQCILDHADPAALRACDVDRPCRDDYICARSASDRGICMPPYFLFQLRVDGHVL